MSSTLRAGAARIIITPPVGVELAGYGFGPSVGVLDDLEAQALFVEAGGEAAVLVTVDCLTVGPAFVAAVRRRVTETLGIAGDRVLISASHSHSSPTAMPLRQWGRVDADYVRCLESHLCGVIGMAYRRAVPARLGTANGRVEGIAENRRSRDSAVDTSVPVIRLDSVECGEPLAVLFAYGCHPVSLHSYRNLVSADYPGFARSVVRSLVGESAVAMFMLGTAGDINPAGYQYKKTTPERSRQIGTILGCEVARVALAPDYQADPVVKVRSVVVDLPLEPLPSAAELTAQRDTYGGEVEAARARGAGLVELSELEIRRDWAVDALAQLEKGSPRTAACEVMAVQLGNAVIVAAPLEIFSETGLAIRRESRFPLTFLCSNANGGVGYLATSDAYRRSDYTNPEGLAPKVYGINPLAEGAEPRFREAAIRLLRSEA